MKHRLPSLVPRVAMAWFFISAMVLRADQPVSGTLLQDAKMDIVAEGKSIGFVKISQGTKVLVLSTNSAGELLVKRTAEEPPFAVPADAVSVEKPTEAPPAPTPTPEASTASPLTFATPRSIGFRTQDTDCAGGEWRPWHSPLRLWKPLGRKRRRGCKSPRLAEGIQNLLRNKLPPLSLYVQCRD